MRLRLLAFANIVLLGGVLLPGTPGRAAPVDTAPVDTAPAPPSTPAERWARDMLRTMSLEQKVGQLFVTYAYGTSAATTDPADVAANQAAYGVDNAAALVQRYQLGGIVYFGWSRNLQDPAQIAALSNGLQRAAAGTTTRIPLLVGADQEHGYVTRIGAPATQFPGNMALGADPDGVADARTAAGIAGRELRAMGVNQNYAPVADVNTDPANPVIGVRSFSSDPDLAARLTGAAVAGYRQSDVVATAKHFPGHGDTDVDSHTGIPVIDRSRDEWRRLDLPPFQAAISAGVDSVMTAHIVVPALDPSGDPATLSAPIVTGILREQLGYDGVVVTDSLAMAGVRQKYGDDRVPVLALLAGVDQLLMPPDLDLAYRSVLGAVRGGELSEQRIDASVLRILRLKHARGLIDDPYVDESAVGAQVGTSEHRAAAREITDRTITLVKNDHGLLPLAPAPGRRVLVTGWGVTTTATLATALGRRGFTADAVATGINPSQGQIDAAVEAARGHDVTVLTTNTVRANPAQRRLVQALLAAGTPLVVVGAFEPYDIAHVPSVPAYLTGYGYTAPTLESLTRVLVGEVSPVGRLPVLIPAAGAPDSTLYPLGHGLTYQKPAGR